MNTVITETDLLGVWSNNVLYAPGAASDEVLIFMPHGVGRAEIYNWDLTEVILFDWQLKKSNALTLISRELISFIKAGSVTHEKDGGKNAVITDMVERVASSAFGLINQPITIQEEQDGVGRTCMVLYICLARYWPTRYGLAKRDVSGMQEPLWNIPSPN